MKFKSKNILSQAFPGLMTLIACFFLALFLTLQPSKNAPKAELSPAKTAGFQPLFYMPDSAYSGPCAPSMFEPVNCKFVLVRDSFDPVTVRPVGYYFTVKQAD